MSQPIDFAEAFKAITGHAPFPWQIRLFKRLSVCDLPSAVDIPTGLGKTSVMAIWLLACAAGARLPRRLVYVVDRRAVVDQATTFAEDIRTALLRTECRALKQVGRGLGLEDRALAISTLRGKYVDNREWLEDPSAPAIIVGTVDMIGSRLLFEGYGVSWRMRSYAAGLMGCDSLVMLDEAHLCRPFEQLLRAIEIGQRVVDGDCASRTQGRFVGTHSNGMISPPFKVLPLSATLGADAEAESQFALNDDDRADEIVRARLEASKTIVVEDLDDNAQLDAVLAERAWELMLETDDMLPKSGRILIYCDSRKVAEKVSDALKKRGRTEAIKPPTLLFVGGRRVREREMAAQDLETYGLIASNDADLKAPVFLVATSAAEVGVDLDSDHMVCDLVSWERMVQRLGRVNRRGMGSAQVLVVDQGPPDEKKAGEDGVARHLAARRLLEILPRNDTGGHQAGPAALASLGDNPEFQNLIVTASTPAPLFPDLTRPLVDAWAMTSLAEHTGRPEVTPWLRGWVDEQPRSTVVWRHCLPVRCEGSRRDPRTQVMEQSEIEEFFDAAPPQTAELLDTETWAVVDWLKKRGHRNRTLLEKGKGGQSEPSETISESDRDGSGSSSESGNGIPDFRLRPNSPVVFLLDGRGKFKESISLEDVTKAKADELNRKLVGQTVVVDARLSGLAQGVLDASNDDPVETIENGWRIPEASPDAKPDESSADESHTIRVSTLSNGDRVRRAADRQKLHVDGGGPPDPWQETLALPMRETQEGEAADYWLVVEKRQDATTDEDARTMSSNYQTLDDHHDQVASEVEKIAVALDLSEADQAMLIAAARHHDDGKSASRWQRAFNAKQNGGPFAKTPGPLYRKVLSGFRHEFQSLLAAEEAGLEGLDRAELRFDLALHLIAAHHGRARPVIGIEGCDSLPPSAAAHRAHEVALRFARLQRQLGPWGLAWWEALLRAADQRASRNLG